MYRKVSGFFTSEKNVSQVTFLPGVRIEYNKGAVCISGESTPGGVPWPGTARQRRIIQALDEQNGELMDHVVPAEKREESRKGKFLLEMTLPEDSSALQWEFELESGRVKIFERGGIEILFAATPFESEYFLFRSTHKLCCTLASETWGLKEMNGIFCCSERSFDEQNSESYEELWQKCEKKNHSRWSEIALVMAALPLSDSDKQQLVFDLNLLFNAPEKIFYFDGNFSCWCAALRKLKSGDILKSRLMKICRLVPFLQFNAKCFAGIDDGLRLPRRCDGKGCPLELDWLIALDSAYSCLCACEMFDYCNTLHDMDFLEKYAFGFMTAVLRTVELAVTPDGYQLQVPYAPLPGARKEDISGFGKNIDRQLFYLHALAERLVKAASMLQVKADPVAVDILNRLPRPRGNWELAPDTEWGRAGKRISEMVY